MKKGLIILLLLTFFRISSNAQPIAKLGVIDLTDWNFNTNELVNLDGQWEFYWLKFYSSEDFRKNDSIRNVQYINFPNYWNGYQYDNKNLSGNGYATYRLLVKLKRQKSNLALKLLTVSTAYTLYINGKEIVKEGKIGTSRESTIPAYRPVIADFYTDTTQLEIIMHIANFHHRAGGPWQVLRLGKDSSVIIKTNISLAIELFLIGSILIMSLYHFGLYSIRRNEKSPLYFGLFCMAMTLRVAVTGEYAANLIHDWEWETLVFFEYLTFYSCVIAFAMFLQSIFPKEFSKIVIKVLSGVYLIFSAFVVFTEVTFYSQTIPYFYPFVFLASFYSLYILIVALYRKREGAFSFLIGISILIFTTLNDILHQNDVIHTMNLSSVGIFCFIFIQAFLLSSRFSRAFFNTERLKDEIDMMNQNLEETVNNRTIEIQQQKEELQAQSEFLEFVNIEVTQQRNDAESSNKRITESIVYAKRIQNVLIPSVDTLHKNNIEHFILFEPRDIVSGDFYWIKEIKNENKEVSIIIAAVDCTGHGVPGAFMSILGMTFMNEIVLQLKITTPSLILNELRSKIKTALHQRKNSIETKDGMDIALCNINKSTNTLEFAGANNPLYRIKKMDEAVSDEIMNSKHYQYFNDESGLYQLTVFKPNKMPIGFYYLENDFTNITIPIGNNENFYIFSDGYVDQFGGELGRKFLIKNLKNFYSKYLQTKWISKRNC